MTGPIKVLDIELSHPITDIVELEPYTHVQGLVRLHGAPLGYVRLPVVQGICPAGSIRRAILEQHADGLIQQLLLNMLSAPITSGDIDIARRLHTPPPATETGSPLVTVAVCTRNRPDDLARCLDALDRLEYDHLEILIIDNAPDDDATQQLVRTQYPHMRYVRELRPGLDWARNRAIQEARGEILAYTDDDVIVDPGWVRALAAAFNDDPAVMAVTGLVVPYELETEAQILFEQYNGFGRGFRRRWVHVDGDDPWRWMYYGTGQYGTGANMAFRRRLFDRIGQFDPALDVGTVTNGGGDVEMFFRLLKEGHGLVYEPNAVVRHRHRRSRAELQSQIHNNGLGFAAYITRSFQQYGDARFDLLKLTLSWLLLHCLRGWLGTFLRLTTTLRPLYWAESIGIIQGLTRYRAARRKAIVIAGEHGASVDVDQPIQPAVPKTHIPPNGTAVRTVDLAQPLDMLTDVDAYASVRLFVVWQDHPIGYVDIEHHGRPISRRHLCQTLVEQLGAKLLAPSHGLDAGALHMQFMAGVAQLLANDRGLHRAQPRLRMDVDVSIVLATLDRPEDLRVCLQHLHALETTRSVEIVVVDNNPASGLTPPVVAAFPSVVLVREPRKGLAYARNAGFLASRGAILIATDDGVIVPPDWLERLVAPFSRPDVMAVTGNVLPRQLDTHAQRMFEVYGGLGRGFESYAVDRQWFDSFIWHAVPTWTLGATANAAFRSTILAHPQIGLMDEALGPGMPSGVGEDTYLFYKILKAGFAIAYEPSAYVWHTHRRTTRALRRQLFGYSKGHVAYHLTTLLRDGDLRSLFHLAFWLPYWRIRQLAQWGLRSLHRTELDYPLLLILLEIYGNLLGPWMLWQSRRRVQREGRSLQLPPHRPEGRHKVSVSAVPGLDAMSQVENRQR